MNFNQSLQVIKHDMTAALNCLFHGLGHGLNSLNQAFIVLLPKEGAASMGDFRSISLMHSFAKIFSLLLAVRLLKRMSKLVAINKSAFIRGRFILDTFLFVQSSIQALLCRKVPSLFLK